MPTTTPNRTYPRASGRWRALMLAAALPLFLGAVLCDYAYWSSYEIQWSNFAGWLMAGALVFAIIALACALLDLLRASRRGKRSIAYLLLLLATVVLGVINALVHARDAWAVMPTGMLLSVVVLALAGTAMCLAVAGWRVGEDP